VASTQLILVRNNAHKLAVFRTLLLEFNVARAFREQGVIPADADVCACMITSATLPDENISSDNFLAAKHFDAQSLGLRITTVLTTAACFLMCHCSVPVCQSTRRLMPGIVNVLPA